MTVEMVYSYYPEVYLICHCLDSKWHEFPEGSTKL